MIVGTAGHIDHGKTTLVRALTGVDTDRLPEEKQRGISIELGYAFLAPPGGAARIGFIDVPGHERLVHTMLAGATGIDHALLLVAADDGVMPQTREHLAVLSLLGITQATVVVTKADRVDAARVQAVRAEAAALLAGTSLAGSPVLAVSATSGQGMVELEARLLDAAATPASRAGADAGFRLAIDRVFTLDGVGTVVTGTVHAGQVAVGDELVRVPDGGGARLRVRSLHAQNQPVQRAGAGQRAAVAVAGLAKDEVARGQWLVAPDVACSSARLDVRLSIWPAESKALRSGTPVHVHLGAAAVMGSVAVLDAAEALAPGATGLVQLVLRESVGAWHGDRVVLRDAAASRTIAGGLVIDPHAPARYRRSAQRLSELQALALPTLQQRARALLDCTPQGLDLGRLRAAAGARAASTDVVAQLGPALALRAHDARTDWALGLQHGADAHAALLRALAEFHRTHPDDPGPDAARLRRLALPRLPEPLWRAVLDDALAQGRVQRSGPFVHLADHGVRLSATEQRIAQKVAPRLAQGSFDGAWVRDLARDLQESEPLLRTTLARLAQRGELHQVVKDLYYAESTIVRLAGLARAVGQAHQGSVTAAAYRDATQLGRKRAIQILEYFDRVGLLRRVGDEHRLRSDTSLFMAAAS